MVIFQSKKIISLLLLLIWASYTSWINAAVNW